MQRTESASVTVKTEKRKPRKPKAGTPSLIYGHRQRRGLSPERFGRIVGVSGMTIRRIEDGRANPRRMHPLTKLRIFNELKADGHKYEDLWPL